MAFTIDEIVDINLKQHKLFRVSGSDGNNTTIEHNLGQEPTSVLVFPKGDAGATAVEISRNSEDVVVNVSNGDDADIYVGIT